ncbi:MAG: hypothetical protein IPJ65_30030 [Archangiaceae bacterium]|nr:hypothetical protein [Archangiaceae bacterium]
MRRPLIVLLGLGVLVGYGSAFAHMRHRMHHGCGDGDSSRWSQRYDEAPPWVRAPGFVPPAAQAPQPPAPAPQQYQQPVVPQIIIVQPQAAAPSAPTTVVVQPPAPAVNNPKANAPSAE